MARIAVECKVIANKKHKRIIKNELTLYLVDKIYNIAKYIRNKANP